MDYLYGKFADHQIDVAVSIMHGEIHKLLLYKDRNTEDTIFENNEDFFKYFKNLLVRYGALNTLMGEPEQMVAFMSTLEAAYEEVLKPKNEYRFWRFRKLILDAHGYLKMMFEEVDKNAESINF